MVVGGVEGSIIEGGKNLQCNCTIYLGNIFGPFVSAQF